MVLKVSPQHWNQTGDCLLQQSIKAAHPRTRERFSALYQVSMGATATEVAKQLGRRLDTITRWIHLYNSEGPGAIGYKRTGGRPPFCQIISKAAACLIDRTLEKAATQEGSPDVPRWTLKYLVQWCWDRFQVRCCRETMRQALKRLGYSWKKARKLLNKADPEKRADFVKRLKPLLSEATSQKRLLVCIDEAHIHQDTDIGYGWSRKGERLWVSSHSPKLADKVTFYGVDYYNPGQVRIWPYPCGRKEHTVNVLERIRQEHPDWEIDIVWDGASWHTAHFVRDAGIRLGLNIIQMPGYSPDFMPVEALWRWLREDVTYHHCHKTAEGLLEAVNCFVDRINRNPEEVADRLWVKDALNDEEERMRAVNLSGW